MTAGDPTLSDTKLLVPAIADAGADIIELGVPFSEPTADGVVNQEAAQRALKSGTKLGGIVSAVKRMRDSGTEVPIILFTYLNPVCAYGVERFAKDAADAGVDGLLLVDVPQEEADEVKPACDSEGLDTVFLVAPTTSKERLPLVVGACSGFVYYVSRAGVTGEKDNLNCSIEENVAAIRSFTDLPVAVGFGVSSPEQVADVAKLADGVVVGSAIVRRIGELGASNGLISGVSELVSSLSAPLREGQ
ncbi:MAG: tryptophan synthase subunit alpha [Candidatus Latescibacteria bacterium]|nr:tryptophan synthase subunit alpha [Candidatus Latescibacterota bacterium]